MTTYTAADVNSWYQAVQFRNSETDPSLVPTVDTYVVQLNSGSVTANQVQQQIIGATYTLTYVNPVIQMYQGLLNRVPDEPGLEYWADQLAGGSSDFWVAYYIGQTTEFSSYYGASGNAAVSEATLNLMYNTIFGTNVDAAGKNYWLNLGLTNWQAAYYLSTGAPADSSMAVAINSFQQAQIAGTEATSGSLYQYGGYPITSTETLTTGVDIFSANFFDGNLTSSGAQTLNSGDQLTGTNVTNTLDATITSSVTPAKLSNIQNLQITATENATLGLLNATGVTTVTNDDSVDSKTLTFSNIGSSVTTLGVANTASDTVFGFTSTSGVQTVGLTLTAAGNSAGDRAGVTIAGIENINITSSGTDNFINLTAVDATNLTVAGAQSLDLGTISTGINSIDASTMTGGLTVTGTNTTSNSITGGSGNDSITGAAGNDNLQGGAGNDTLTSAAGNDSLAGGKGDDRLVLAGNLTANDTVDGGEGINTLAVSANVAVGDAVNITNISTLETSLGGGATQNLAAFTGTTLTRVNSTQTGGSVTFSNASADLATFGISGAAPGTVSLTLQTDNLSGDNIAVEIGNAADKSGSTVTALNLNDNEQITFNSVGGANTVTTLTANDLTTVVVTGEQKLDITNNVAGSTLVTSVDAAAATGDVGVRLGLNAVAVTMTGGSGSDTLTSGSGNDSLVGGSGNDSLTGNNGNDTISGDDGLDTIDGGAGNDQLSGGAGNDTITAGTGNDSILGGDGNDLINFTTSGDLTASDTVDGGAGTNTVAVTTAVATTTAPTLTNIQQVNLKADSGLTTFNLAGATALTTLKVLGTGTDDSYTVSGLANNVTAVLDAQTGAAADVSLTLDTVAAASLTVDVNDTTAGFDYNLTVSDAKVVKINNTSAVNGALTSLVLDNTDTTSLTVNGGNTVTIGTGAITQSAALSTVEVNATTLGGNAVLGTIGTATGLKSLTLSANRGDVTTGAIGGVAIADSLASVNVTATNAATAALGAITADTSDSVTDLDMTVNLTSNTASTVDYDNINNQYGTITLTTAGAGTITHGQTLTAVDVIVNAGGSGTQAITTITASDDVTINATNAGAVTFSTVTTGASSTALLDVTASGSGTLTLTTLSASAGTTMISGADATGSIVMTTNSRTGVASLTGGSAADTLVGGTAADSIVGGAGNDSLVGAGGFDTVLGGDGEDTIDVSGAAGVVSVSGGADNDVINLGTHLKSTDFIDGGAGINTAQFTLGLTEAPTLENIQIVDLTSNAGGAFVASLSTSLTTINNLAASVSGAIVTYLKTGVTFANADIGNTTYIDTAAGASLTYSALADNGALTVEDVASLTINATDTAAAGDTNSVTLDEVDTTSLTVNGANTAFALTTGNISSSNALKTLTVATTTASGTVTVGTLADADGLTSLVLDATNANATVGAIGAGGSAEVLTSVQINAAGAVATTGAITADTTDSATDLNMDLSAQADSAGRFVIGAIDNQYGTISAGVTTANSAGAASTVGALQAAEITLTVEGSGDVTFAGIDTRIGGTGIGSSVTVSSSADIIINNIDSDATATINASAMTSALSTLTVVFDDVVGNASVTSGAGSATITTANGAINTGGTSITLGAANAVVDTINLNATNTDTTQITNFTTSSDIVEISIGGWNTGTGDMANYLDDGAGTAVLGTETVDFFTITGAVNLANAAATDNVLVLDGTFATVSLVATALQAGGSFELTSNPTGGNWVANTNAMLVLWDDGSNSYLSSFTGASLAGNTFTSGVGGVTNIVTLIGIADATAITAADLGTAFNA